MPSAAMAHTPNAMNVATTAQQMAKSAGQDRMALAFQTVALVSMAIMGTAAAYQMLRQMNCDNHSKGR
ncbi:MAG: hypothetical protein U0746_02960 [Gemmataceae bacterium]